MTRSGSRSALLHLVFFFSGAAGLGYQMAWSKLFAAGLGHELPAVLAVVGAFMGGMALGAGGLDRAISRSERPGRWYAALEWLIGGWGFLTTALVPFVNQSALHLIGLEPSPLRHWAAAFVLPFLALLPATAAMGATLPAMERLVSPLIADGRCVGTLYAANTFGAMTGTLASAFVILPALGLRETVWWLAAVNLLCGAAVWAMQDQPMRKAHQGTPVRPTAPSPRAATGSPRNGGNRPIEAAQQPDPVGRWRLGVCVFLTGLLGIGYETVGVRVLAQVLENTVYTFAAVLAVFLVGTAGGAAGYQRFGRRRPFQPLFGDLLCGLALAGLIGIFSLSHAQTVYNAGRTALGDGEFAVLLAEMGVATTVFGPLTLLGGAIFSQLAQAARRPDGGVGEALAWNTLGGALAPAWFSVALLPKLGSKWTLALISLGYLALLSLNLTPAVRVRAGWRRAFALAPLAMIVLLPRNLHLVQVPPDCQVIDYRDGVMASVAVVQDATGNRNLRVDNHFQMGGTGATDAERRHAHLPLLLHAAPKRALFLGLGTGITFGAASVYPGLQADGVELLPEVVAVMRQFEPNNLAPGRQPQLKLYVADARRFVRAVDARFDVIVADLFHPARDGAGSLYTVEHFQAIRQQLAPRGLFCQWLPLHQLDEATLRVILRTFLEVFPETHAYLLRFNVDAPVVGLVGNLDSPRFSTRWVERRLGAPALEAQLKSLALADSIRLFGCLIAGPADLRRFAGAAPLNTDDHPVVTFAAPRFIYRRNVPPYASLFAMLRQRNRDVGALLNLDGDPAAGNFRRRLADFLNARDVYLGGLVADAEGHSSQAIDAYVESARLSPDFTSGYAQCLTLAALEARSDPSAARALLERLIAAQPAQPVARELLKRLRER